MRIRLLLSLAVVALVAAVSPPLVGTAAAAPPLPLANDSFSWVLPGAGGSPVNATQGPDGAIWTTLLGSDQLARTDEYGVTKVFDLPAGSGPLGIAAGPDGNIWFTATGTNKIGRMTTAGVLTEFAIPTPAANPVQITAGVDGDLWFTEADADRIARITTDGTIIEHVVPEAASKPTGIVVRGTGSSAEVIFSEFAADKLVSYSPATDTFTTLATTTTPNAGASQVALFPDGAVAVTLYDVSKIGILSTGGTFTEHDTPTPGAFPLGIAAGPDGRAWFSEWDAMNIGAISPDGTITEYPATTNGQVGLTDVVPISATEVWYVSNKQNRVGRLTIGPSPFTAFPLDDHAGPYQITAGPDGAMWYTRTDNHIGRTAMDGASTKFAIPSPNDEAGDIAAGPDGALWFTEVSADKIGRIATDGTITEFAIPTPGARSEGITTGPDGNIWFTATDTDKIGRLTPTGTFTEFDVPTAGAKPSGITTGPDGNVWFTEAAKDKIGRSTPAGTITEFAVPAGTQPQAIATGPDGNLWFNGFNGTSVGHITPTGTVTTWPNFAMAQGMAVGSDGNMWYADLDGWINNVTMAGERRGHWYGSTDVTDVATGPDGNIWFANINADRVSRYNVHAPVETSIQVSGTPAPGATLQLTVPVKALGVDDAGCVTVDVAATVGNVAGQHVGAWSDMVDCPVVAMLDRARAPFIVHDLPHSPATAELAITLPAGSSATATFDAVIPADAAPGSQITYTATIAGSTPGTAATASVTVTLPGQATSSTAPATTAASTTGTLPATGAGGATFPLAIWGLCLLAIGGVCTAYSVRAGRSRRRA